MPKVSDTPMPGPWEFFLHDDGCVGDYGLREVSDDGSCPVCGKPLVFVEGAIVKGPKTMKQPRAALRRMAKRFV